METLTLDINKRYSFADYLTWFDDKRRELYNGLVKIMSAPRRKHQKISVIILNNIFNYLKNKKCEVYAAPFDVRLPENGDKDNKKIFTVVQPDIVVVCDPKKLDEKGCIGAPDLIVEILSPSTGNRDLKDKFLIYEKHGVKEYWVANPDLNNIQIFILDEALKKYQFQGTFIEGDDVSPSMFPDLIIKIDEIFTIEVVK